jgi:hypothetical protein
MATRAPSINKVFGIGSQKTGTTTLGYCLQALGFTPHVLRPESKVIRAYARDPEIVLRYAERYRSFQDAPWSYEDFYQQLDRRFPRSKFILTERDVDRWFASFVAYKKAPGRERSDIRYRFPNPRVGALSHRLSWGIDYERLGDYAMEPHEATYRSVYERRNERIREYFEQRPHDLLVVDWEKGDGWAELCDFLGVDVPDLPFPHANVGTKHPPIFRRLLARGIRGALAITGRFRQVR